MRRLLSVLVLALTAATAAGKDAVIAVESIASLNRGEAMMLRLDDREYILRVEPYSVRAPGMVVRVYGDPGETDLRVLRQTDEYTDFHPGPVRTFRGEVFDRASTEHVGRISGRMTDDGAITAGVHLVDEDRHVWIEPRLHADGIDHIVATRGESRQRSDPVPGPVDVFCANLGIDMDYEYFSHFDSLEEALAWVELMLTEVNIQFTYQVQIKHRLPLIVIHAEPDGHDGSNLIAGVFDEWQTDHASEDWDFIHILTGLDFAGQGFGFIGAVCRDREESPLSLAEYSNSLNRAVHTTEHQLGHNWNAIDCDCPRHTMFPAFSNPVARQFSQESIDRIVAYRDTRSCLEICDSITLSRRELPFDDDFEDEVLDVEDWPTAANSAVVDGAAEISAGGDLISASFNTRNLFGVDFSYSWRPADVVPPGSTLCVEYMAEQYRWELIECFDLASADPGPYVEAIRLYSNGSSYDLPLDMESLDFQVRFRVMNGGEVSIDDVSLVPYSQNPCIGDCLIDGAVNIDDLLRVVAEIGQTFEPHCDFAPMHPDGTFGNGITNFDDIIAVINNFGLCDNPPPG